MSLQGRRHSQPSAEALGCNTPTVCCTGPPCSRRCTPTVVLLCLFACLQVIPILRAGLVLLEQAATLLPASETYHLGYVRDDETLQVGGSGRN